MHSSAAVLQLWQWRNCVVSYQYDPIRTLNVIKRTDGISFPLVLPIMNLNIHVEPFTSVALTSYGTLSSFPRIQIVSWSTKHFNFNDKKLTYLKLRSYKQTGRGRRDFFQSLRLSMCRLSLRLFRAKYWLRYEQIITVTAANGTTTVCGVILSFPSTEINAGVVQFTPYGHSGSVVGIYIYIYIMRFCLYSNWKTDHQSLFAACHAKKCEMRKTTFPCMSYKLAFQLTLYCCWLRVTWAGKGEACDLLAWYFTMDFNNCRAFKGNIDNLLTQQNGSVMHMLHAYHLARLCKVLMSCYTIYWHLWHRALSLWRRFYRLWRLSGIKLFSCNMLTWHSIKI